MAIEPGFELLAGFRYHCRPGCGLCCYTTPAVAPMERARLIQLDPSAPLLETSDDWAQIASRPDGGACHFLRAERCTCHSVRPAVCGEFPLTVHLGDRVQVSLVLTCPGVDLSPLNRWRDGPPAGTLSSDFLDEIVYVKQALRRAESAGQFRWAAQRRQNVERRLRRQGSWQSEKEVRDALGDQLDTVIPATLAEEAPSEEEPLESLPMFFDPAFGRVAWRPHSGGVEFLTLQEAGGIGRHLGVLAVPARAPGLSGPARELLRGYLGYLLDRDATINAAYDYLLAYGPALPRDVVADDLELIAGQVLRLATLRRSLTSDARGELSAPEVEAGIRATDMDILDRPTAGLRL